MTVMTWTRCLAGAALLLVLSIRVAAESPRPASAAEPAANKQIMTRMIEELWNGGHLELCEELFVPDGVVHHRGHDIPGTPADCRRVVSTWRGGLEDFHFTVHSLLAEGDLVVAYLTFTGKHTKPLLGMPPSGKSVKVDQMLLVRIANGKIVELSEVYDEYALRREIGNIPAPQPPPASPAPPAPQAPPAPPAKP